MYDFCFSFLIFHQLNLNPTKKKKKKKKNPHLLRSLLSGCFHLSLIIHYHHLSFLLREARNTSTSLAMKTNITNTRFCLESEFSEWICYSFALKSWKFIWLMTPLLLTTFILHTTRIFIKTEVFNSFLFFPSSFCGKKMCAPFRAVTLYVFICFKNIKHTLTTTN